MLVFCSTLFILLIVLSIIKPRMNPGLPAFLFALLIAPFTSTSAATNPLKLFPIQLFLTLLGITVFFVGLNSRGFVSEIVLSLFQKFEARNRLIPPAVFFLVALLTAIGVGNIATVALMAPLAIPLAAKLKMSPFVMTVVVVGGANAASFSPLTLPGIVTHNFIQRTIFLEGHPQLQHIHWWTFWIVFGCISATTLLSYKIFKSKNELHADPRESSQHPQSFKFKTIINTHKQTLTIAGVLAGLFLTANVSSLPMFFEFIPQPFKHVVDIFKNVGLLGWLGSALLILSGNFNLQRHFRSIPWGTITLVCGMSTYIELLSTLGLAESIAHFTAKNAPHSVLPSLFAGSSGLLSAFSSSVGVALPLFFPIIESISQNLTAGLAAVLIYSVAVGSHLVDASPLSTLGALCLSQITDQRLRTKSYRSLLIYSFLMIPVAGIWGYVLYLLFS